MTPRGRFGLGAPELTRTMSEPSFLWVTVGRSIFLVAELDGNFWRCLLVDARKFAELFRFDFCLESFPEEGFLDNPVLEAGRLDTQPTASRKVRPIARNNLNVRLNPLQIERQTFF